MARLFPDPYAADAALDGLCACGRHAGALACDAAPATAEETAAQAVDVAVARAVLGPDATRRALLRGVGAATLTAAIGAFFPLAAA
ncbi:nitrate ABC transporter substrate-binding protein, partial [Roseomonas sp. NAR14]|nr:nitrate ABC transporter substrate-binding protein [Roseomonas acroporae]